MDLPRENRIRGERSPSHNSEEYQYLKCGDKEKYFTKEIEKVTREEGGKVTRVEKVKDDKR